MLSRAKNLSEMLRQNSFPAARPTVSKHLTIRNQVTRWCNV